MTRDEANAKARELFKPHCAFVPTELADDIAAALIAARNAALDEAAKVAHDWMTQTQLEYGQGGAPAAIRARKIT